MPTTVLSYNVRQSHRLADAFLNRCHTYRADAICFQEAGSRLYSPYDTYTDCYQADGYIDDPCAVVTMLEERASLSRSLDIMAGAVHNRSSMLVKLRDHSLIIVNAHLTSGNINAATQELDIMKAILRSAEYRRYPALIIGDLNHFPARENGWMRIRGPVHSSGSYLDWALAWGVTGLTSVSIPNYSASDHAPFGVTVTL
jgi:endonuclease/exonuclease/phosphatase family metal-dependent hydrolase